MCCIGTVKVELTPCHWVPGIVLYPLDDIRILFCAFTFVLPLRNLLGNDTLIQNHLPVPNLFPTRLDILVRPTGLCFFLHGGHVGISWCVVEVKILLGGVAKPRKLNPWLKKGKGRKGEYRDDRQARTQKVAGSHHI
jgi:hypothetical protein